MNQINNCSKVVTHGTHTWYRFIDRCFYAIPTCQSTFSVLLTFITNKDNYKFGSMTNYK